MPDKPLALVTGGARGIGFASARALAADGARLVLADIDGTGAADAAAGLGGDAMGMACDMADPAQIEALFDRIEAEAGPVSVLVNCAGIAMPGEFLDTSLEDFRKVIDVNLTGTFYVSQAVWPHLVAAGGGAVVNMSSLAAQRGFSPKMKQTFGATSSSYYAAKAGVDALTRYMAGIGGSDNIRVNCVRPGQILTPGATGGTSNDPDGGHHVFEEMFNFAQIVEGPGYPEDVANLVLFLSCDESRFISGEMINVDGGVAAKI